MICEHIPPKTLKCEILGFLPLHAKRKEMKNSRTRKDKDNKIIPYPWGRH
jgi:hypothetical protein